MGKPVGFFRTVGHADTSYNTTLVITICYPRNLSNLRQRIMSGLIFVLSTCGIVSSGQIEPADALKRNQNQEEI